MKYWRRLSRAIRGLEPEEEAGVAFWRELCSRMEVRLAERKELWFRYYNECRAAHKGIERLKRKIKRMEATRG
jgi:hypothetical protein